MHFSTWNSWFHPTHTVQIRRKRSPFTHFLPYPHHQIQPINMMLPPQYTSPRSKALAALTWMTVIVSSQEQSPLLCFAPSVSYYHSNQSDTHKLSIFSSLPLMVPIAENSKVLIMLYKALHNPTISPPSSTSLTLVLILSVPVTLLFLLLCKHHQADSGLRAFASTVPSTWKTLPPKL